MANVNGTAGNDLIHVAGDGREPPDGYTDNPGATDFADLIDISQGGNDIVLAGLGNDNIVIGAAFTASDAIDGGEEDGTDTDVVFLDGDYGAGLTFGADTMRNVEVLGLAAGHDYKLKIHDATVSDGMFLAVVASGLGAGDTLNFDGSRETDGFLYVTGGAGHDVIKGGFFGNGYYLTEGGNDTATGTVTLDYFYMGAELTAKDRLIGGGGTADTVFLDGDYARGVTLKANTIADIDQLQMAAGNNYKLTLNDGTVAAGGGMTFDAGALGHHDKFTLDASSETDGTIFVTDGAGRDKLTGGQHANVFDLSRGSNDIVTGGAGHDQFNFGSAFTTADHVDGGGGTDDVVTISSTHAVTLSLSGTTLQNVGTLQMLNGTYTITTQDDLVTAGHTMTFQAQAYSGSHPFTFDGSAETDGAFTVRGGLGNDSLTGSGGNDILKGYNGKDTLTPGAGADTIVYGINGVAESTGVNCDVVVGFDFNGSDKFDFLVPVGGVDTTIASGFLSAATFDTDLATAITGAKLAIGHAVVFTPDNGPLAGHNFLIVDVNEAAGYQAAADYVIELVSPVNLGDLDTADFI